MTEDNLGQLYDRLHELLSKGDQAAAQKLVAEEFEKLPDELQGRILNNVYFAALQKQNTEAAAIADIQEKGLKIIQDIEKTERRGTDHT